jgi:hypothetical protein
VEYGGLVHLVHEADRHQQEARAQAHVLPGLEVQIGELRGDFALLLVPFAGGGVLHLQLGVEEDAVAELVADVEDVAHQVDAVRRARRLIVLPAVGRVVVDGLAVAADRDPVRLGVDLGGRRPEAGHGLARLGLRGSAGPRLLDLGGQEVDPPLQLGQPLVGAAGRLETGHLGLQRLDLLAQILVRRLVRAQGPSGAGQGQHDRSQRAARGAASYRPAQSASPMKLKLNFIFNSADDTSRPRALSNTRAG